MAEERYKIDKNGTIRPDPPMDGCTGCGLVLAGIIAIPLLLKLLTKIPGDFGWIFQSIYNLVEYILIKIPIELIKVFFDSLPPIVRVIVIAVLVLPIIIYVILWIKRKIDKMN